MSTKAKVGHSRLGTRQRFVLAQLRIQPNNLWGNFIIGPTHAPAPETIAKEGVPRGTITSFIFSSKDSVIYNPGLIRDDVAGCGNSSIMIRRRRRATSRT